MGLIKDTNASVIYCTEGTGAAAHLCNLDKERCKPRMERLGSTIGVAYDTKVFAIIESAL